MAWRQVSANVWWFESLADQLRETLFSESSVMVGLVAAYYIDIKAI